MEGGMEILRNSGTVRKGDPRIESGTGVVFISCEFEIVDCQGLIVGNRMAIPKEIAISELGLDVACVDSSVKGSEKGRRFD
jgi:hypothetical protein